MAAKVTKLKPRAPAPRSEPQPSPNDPIVARIVLTFQVDGRAVGQAAFPVAFPAPPGDQAVTLELKLDARALLQQLEPALGPQKPALWVPAH